MDLSDDDTAKPTAGPGVTAWLADIIGASGSLNSINIHGPVALPDGFQGAAPALQRFLVLMPLALDESDDAVLASVEIRDLPKGVQLTAGSIDATGVWQVPSDALSGLLAMVPASQPVPFGVVLKATFASPDDRDDTWTEMLNIDIDTPANDVDAADAPGAPDFNTHISSVAIGPELSVIDLDVSVGTDDPAALAKLKVSFSVLPDGAFLTAGTEDPDGTWCVPADMLATLSVVMPLDTPDFDLRVTMESDGAPPQSAEIHVANDDTSLRAIGAMLSVDIAPPPDGGPCRLMIFADAKAVYDRVLTWSTSGAQSIIIDIALGDLLPDEIVLRHSSLAGKGTDGPALQWLVIDGVRTGPEDAAVIRCAGEAPGSWVGDLVIDVQAARRPAPNLVSAGDSTNSETAATTLPPTAPIDESAETDALIINVSQEDIRKPTVLAELARLRDFICASADDNNKSIYGRLGLDVGKWRDMLVLGPTGAEVELRATLPVIARLSVPGGRDNTRTPEPLHLSMPDGDETTYHVSGLAAGALLTAGTNLGKGVWALRPEDRPHAAYLPPVQGGGTAVIRIEDAAPDADTNTQLTRLVGNTIAKLRPTRDAPLTLSLTLPSEIFDPNGYNSLSLTMGDVPPGVLIMNGTNHGGGVWTAEVKAGHGIGFCTRAGAASFSLTITCIAMRSETGESTVVTQRINISPALKKCTLAEGLAA
tara:strand:- start:11665 stop:13782 length:2118 start_codon:yes stop_codon:yes gene_type:complete